MKLKKHIQNTYMLMVILENLKNVVAEEQSSQFNMIIHLKLLIVFLYVKIINAGTGIQ